MKVKRNKKHLALGLLVRDFLSEVPLKKLEINPTQNRLSLSREYRTRWVETAQKILPTLDRAGIKYVLTKVYDVPKVKLEDIDLLIEDKREASRAHNILREELYSLYKDRYSLNPLKVTAIQPENIIQVDIYPEATWFNMKYAPKSIITERRVRRRILGINAYMPDPSCDAYIVASHSYNHGFVSLAEAAYFVRLVNEYHLDWNFLINISNDFRLNHALLIYLKLAKLSTNEDENEIQELITRILQKDSLSRLYSAWFDKAAAHGFPLVLPLKLRLLTAFVRIFRVSSVHNFKGYDELIGYGLSLIFRGDRRELVKGNNS
ncbi:MAG: nucleotidyltransferase family protein [Candidatus Bathyarchaeia archaeon]|jgi:hypothetical protein